MKIICIGLILLCIWPFQLFAKAIAIPMRLEHRLIEQVLVDQVFTGKDHTFLALYQEGGCSKVVLQHPKVDYYNGLLRVRANIRVKLGQELGQQCLSLIHWQGKIDLFNRIKLIAHGKKVAIKTVDSRLLTSNGKIDTATDTVWQIIKTNIYPVMNKTVIDVYQPVQELKALLPGFLDKEDKKKAARLVNSFRISHISNNPDGILLYLQFDVADYGYKSPPQKPLTPLEMQQFERRLNALDSYMTLVIESFLSPKTPETLRTSLLDMLIELRYEIADLLKNPQKLSDNAVKKLFLNTWVSLSPVIREISKHYGNQAQSIHYMTFFAAQDVLLTLEQLGKGFGLDISVNGLRLLARTLNSDYKLEIDKLNENAIPAFRLNDAPIKTEALPPVSVIQNWLRFFIRDANASNTLNKKMLNRLNHWVPGSKDIKKYLPMVQQVLAHAINNQIRQHNLKSEYQKVYRSLVYATAWQESCWRQFEVIKRQRWPLTSQSGDLGMMQINPRIWRGFYNIHDVKWDILYNANAGAGILMHYLVHYGLKNKEHIINGKVENLARAAYAGYNGGPKQVNRYRNPNTSKAIKRVDEIFYKKFKQVYRGDALAVKSCY